MKVYKTTSVSLAKRVEVTEKSVPKIDIYGEVSAKLGEPLKIMAWDNDSNMVTVETEEVFETATNTPFKSRSFKTTT